MQELSYKEFGAILPKIVSRQTSLDPDNWTSKNPLWGHCAVVSLLVQNLFGGELVRASLLEVPGFEHMRSHYWNLTGDGKFHDFTQGQFGSNYPKGLKSETRDRSYVLSFPETKKRYKLLALRLAKALNDGNRIFENPIYRKCFKAALNSPCQKMKFGCVITHKGKVVYEGCNDTIGPLKSLCEPNCIRFGIASRTESMLGACGHAEEGMWSVIHQGIPISECKLYIAGLYANGLPWLKKAAEHTCLRCSVQMYNARLKTIYVPVIDKWVGISPEEAINSAKAYATKEKTV